MKIIVIYKSKTGFTQKYADMVAKELKCKAVNYNDVTETVLLEYDTVIFGSRIHAGKIDGLKKAKELCLKNEIENFIIFTTGGTPNAEVDAINTVWQSNLSQEELASVPHFYMQSGLSYERMSTFDRFIMKAVSYVMSKKKRKDSYETGFEQAIQSSYDNSSKEYIEPLVDYVKNIMVQCEK